MTIGERIKKLREEKNITVDKLAELIGKNRATIYRYESSEIEKLPTSVLVPVDYMPTYITCPSEQDKYIWINVHGDSMSPLIDDGSKILIKKQTSVDSGQIAAVLVDDEEAVVKKVLYNDSTVELHSVNPYYPPRVFKNPRSCKRSQ